jgi:hypothetical protein
VTRCQICGDLGADRCEGCCAVEIVLTIYRALSLSLIVDGGYAPAGEDAREAPRVHRDRYAKLRDQVVRDHPGWDASRIESALVESLTGAPPCWDPGHGGAGLVLVAPSGKILASRSCGFPTAGSSEAELHAVIRGALWVPGAVIYTDSESARQAASSSTKKVAVRLLDVRFLSKRDRGPAHALAHQLSVEGRARQARRGAEAA